MNLELHLLQNFAPSCLNRDDTNSPKDCRFGGYRRARISSQCIKRSIRRAFDTSQLLTAEDRAIRSARLVDEISRRIADLSSDAEQRQRVIALALSSQKLTVKDDNRTQYLLFIGQREIDALADVIRAHWTELTDVVPPAEESDGEANKKSARKTKAQKKASVPAEVTQAVETVLDGGKAADLALFGRMLADLPRKNVDAASQVAHAISTNKIDMEMDYFTAVDDLKTREEDAGAGMLGVVEYNSACFYRYANISLPQLIHNLQGDEDLARRTVEAFLSTSVEAIPTGKQNTFAAHNPPSLVFAVLRHSGFWSLANAFVKPIRPTGELSLVEKSTQALDRYWGQLVAGYGSDDVVTAALFSLDEQELPATADYRQPSVQAVVETVIGSLDFTEKRQEVA